MNKTEQHRPKVVFFDVNETLLDLTELKNSVTNVLNGKDELVPLWFSTMLHYSLVETTAETYSDFGEIGAATLQMVAANNGIDLSKDNAKKAIKPIQSLQPHPEVEEALAKLQQNGFKMISLTNGSNEAVKNQFNNAGLDKYFEDRLSIEDIKMYKPHLNVYKWAAKKVGMPMGDCMMVAAHGWDIAGALWAGWRAAFISRPGKQLYPLAPKPELNEPDLMKIVNKLIQLK